MTTQKIALSFQEIMARLQEYWVSRGCLAWLPYHEPVGAGTCNSATVLRVLGPEPWNVAYVEPSFRPDDGRYADNPNRMQMHHQFQVILKPGPADPLGIYLGSLEALGLNLREHDVRFVEDNWESPALGAWGLGWEVWLDGMEITQFTYFQQAGGAPLDPPAVEITYGLERIAMYLQDVSSVWDLCWNGANTYGEILKQQEIEFCVYDFDTADIDRVKNLYELYVKEARLCLEKGLVIPAHDHVLRCSNAFNILDTRGAIGLAERVKFFAEMRGLSRGVADAFLAQRKERDFPLLKHMPRAEVAKAGALPAPSLKTETFLFELGTEELAASVPEVLCAQLTDGITNALSESRLSFGAVQNFATPRRLVVQVESVQPMQADMTLSVRGPRRDVCEKNPKALEGFCRKNGIEASQVRYEMVDGAEFATASVEVRGKSAAAVLAERMPQILGRLRADSNMRWLASAQVGDVAHVSFNRPIRWIVALLGGEIVPFAYANVASGRTSIGGRWAGSPRLEVTDAASYALVMRENKVLLDQAERKKVIRAQVEEVAAKAGGIARIREAVLDEVTQLVEYPTAFLGTFNEEFQSLPVVVLAGTMEKHLRCFPVMNATGGIIAFIGVRNGGSESIDIVRKGYERVIGARFSDAAFFVSRDATKKIEDFRERIKTLTFVEKLGSMFDKTERLKHLVGELSKTTPELRANGNALERAAMLSKADLGSQMVIEMSSLQGKMGRLYAEQSGESKAVAQAIEEQYLPAFSGDKLPESPEGILLSLADKIDTVAALFSIGAEPTGSADPFGIRREALGILHLLLGKGLHVRLRDVFTLAVQNFKPGDEGAVVSRVLDFMSKRLEVVLRERGFRYDQVRSVLAAETDRPAVALEILSSLEKLSTKPGFDETMIAYLRCARILAHAAEKGVAVPPSVDRALLAEAAEQALYQEFSQKSESGSIEKGFAAIGALVKPIHTFFDTVMVMAPDERVRANRLALAGRVASFLQPYGDFRLLEIAGQ